MHQLNTALKGTWTIADFAQMGWHDCPIHALAFDDDAKELLLDIDYIVEWIQPQPEETYFSFGICPTTLVFHHVGGIILDHATYGSTYLFINEISFEIVDAVSQPYYSWSIDLLYGEITLTASSYTQYLRHLPMQTSKQRLSFAQRGGISFERRGFFGTET